MKNKKTWYNQFFFSGIILCALTGGLIQGCAQEPPVIRLAAISGSDQEPTILFEGFKMVNTKEDKLLWIFNARSAQIYEKINIAKAQDIEIIYLKDGKKRSTLTAKKGLLNTKSNHMQVKKNVVMVSTDGVILKTEKLNWDQSKERIYTDQSFRVERENSILTGKGMEADSDLKHIQVLANVRIDVKSIKGLKNNEK